MEELISVIVPVYNVEKYLSSCIESIINQTYHNLEILLIDDGSTDNSGKICDEYAQKDERIHVVHQENKGQSCARNVGIKRASGRYIAFVDSDDRLHLKMYEKLISMMKEKNADIAFCELKAVSEKEQVEDNIDESNIYEKFLTPSEALREILLNAKVGNYVMIKLFKRELFDKLLFPENKVYEDVATLYKIVHRAERIAYTNQELYYYLVGRSGATTSTFTEKKIKDSLEAYHDQYKFIVRNYPDLNQIASLIFCKMYTSAIEKICMNHYLDMLYIDEVQEKYIDFKNAFKNLNTKLMIDYLEPYRIVSILTLNYDIEVYKMIVDKVIKIK